MATLRASALLPLLLAGFAALAPPAARGQQWQYFRAGDSGPASTLTVSEGPAGAFTATFREPWEAGGFCSVVGAEAEVHLRDALTVVLVPPRLNGCNWRRFLLRADGSGWEEQNFTGDWRPTGGTLRGPGSVRSAAPIARAPEASFAPPLAAAPQGDRQALERLQQQLQRLQQELAAEPQPQPQPQPQPGAPAPRKVRALVVGNASYAHFGRLANPGQDATAIAAKLRGFGIAVDLVLDADRDALLRALADFHARAGDADLSILYYAGHGLQVQGINYLVPVDMRAAGMTLGEVKLAALPLPAALEQMPGAARLVFLDACRDNPVSRSLASTRGAGGLGLAPMTLVAGTLISYATRDGATADDGQGLHSPYTAALLEHLDQPMDIGLVLRHVRQSVLRATGDRQEPWEYGSLVGDELVLPEIARPAAR